MKVAFVCLDAIAHLLTNFYKVVVFGKCVARVLAKIFWPY